MPHNLPDPGVVCASSADFPSLYLRLIPRSSTTVDALLKRREFTPHPSGISSLLFSFATLIIHR